MQAHVLHSKEFTFSGPGCSLSVRDQARQNITYWGRGMRIRNVNKEYEDTSKNRKKRNERVLEGSSSEYQNGLCLIFHTRLYPNTKGGERQHGPSPKQCALLSLRSGWGGWDGRVGGENGRRKGSGNWD